MMTKSKEKKTEIIRIRCRPSTKQAWKEFVARGGFKNSEEALLYLLRKRRVTFMRA